MCIRDRTDLGYVALRAYTNSPADASGGSHSGLLRFEVSDTSSAMAGDHGRCPIRPLDLEYDNLGSAEGIANFRLKLCRRIAELLGGTLEVGGVAGQGGRFVVALPLTSPVCNGK